jgi:hypothetical protein
MVSLIFLSFILFNSPSSASRRSGAEGDVQAFWIFRLLRESFHEGSVHGTAAFSPVAGACGHGGCEGKPG